MESTSCFKFRNEKFRLLRLEYDDQNFIAPETLNTEDLEGCEFSKKFRAKSSGDNYGKTNGICRTLKSFKLLENPLALPYKAL